MLVKFRHNILVDRLRTISVIPLAKLAYSRTHTFQFALRGLMLADINV